MASPLNNRSDTPPTKPPTKTSEGSASASVDGKDAGIRRSVRVGALSDIGMRRRNNQDSFVSLVADSKSAWEQQGHLFVVADGMGAHAAGELASRLAVDLIPHHYNKQNQDRAVDNLHRAVIEANNEIYRRGQANIDFRNMGTTTSALAILPEGAICAHVGDSRIYFLRGNTLEQLTFDHSLVWEMQAASVHHPDPIDVGMIPKNVITRSLGPNASVLIDVEGPFNVRVGDRFLLCSDGLTGQLTDAELGVLMRVLPPETAAQAMIDLANLRGGPDNITVIIVEVIEGMIATQPGRYAQRERNAQDSYPFPVSLAIIAAISVLAALILLLVQQLPLAIVAFVFGCIALAAGAIRYGVLNHHAAPSSERVGKAPYRRYVCDPDSAMIGQLAGPLQALSEVIEESGRKEAAVELGKMRKLGADAEAKKNYIEAAKQYGLAIVQAMKVIREQRK